MFSDGGYDRDTKQLTSARNKTRKSIGMKVPSTSDPDAADKFADYSQPITSYGRERVTSFKNKPVGQSSSKKRLVLQSGMLKEESVGADNRKIQSPVEKF